MSLTGSLQIGRSGLLASQRALEVTGNNLANVATRGYHRQEVSLTPGLTQRVGPGVFVGRGVQIDSIVRRVNEALEDRLRGGVAQEHGFIARQEVLKEIESIQNELSDTDLSSSLSAFFNAWSDLANSPQDNAARSLLVQEAQTLASQVRDQRSELTRLQSELDDRIGQAASAADALLSQLEQLNQQITLAEGGSPGGAHGLRDERGAIVEELSQYLDVSVVEQPNGAFDVYVGSIPIVLNGRSRGVEVRSQTVDGEKRTDLVLRDDGSLLDTQAGRLGALVAGREGDVSDALDALDGLARSLIFEVNRLHSQGQGLKGYAELTSTYRVDDATLALNDPDAGLAFTPSHGGFDVHLTQVSTGQRTTTRIPVDLDGIGADTSLNDLAAALSAVGNLSATVSADGHLTLTTTGSDFELSFSDDSSGTLAALGLGAFFEGEDATDLAVHQDVASDLRRVAAGQGHVPGDNRNAVALAGLRERQLDSLGGRSLTELWNQHVSDFGIRLGQATAKAASAAVVRENLEVQRQSYSGVNTDEEAVNLLTHQRAYQASARFLSVVDEMLQTLLNLV